MARVVIPRKRFPALRSGRACDNQQLNKGLVGIV